MTYEEANDDLHIPQKPFKVVAVIPVHERLELLPLTIGRLYKKNRVDTVICVGDGIKEKAICIESGAMWVDHVNKPLGRKWNAGYLAAKSLHPDAVLYTGSSDWISEDWIHVMKPHVQAHHIVGVAGCQFIDVRERIRAVEWHGYTGDRENETIGIGRMISAELLDRIQWQPFDNIKDNSMDRCMKEKCEKIGVKEYFVRDERLKAASISTNKWVNKHVFEHHWSGAIPSEKIFDKRFIIQQFPEVNDLLSALK